MNERIRELAIEAGIIINFNDPLYGQLSEGTKQKQLVITKKFAELIVRECAELSVNSQYTNTKSEYYEGFNEALVYAGNKIKQHFGVEE
jgi:hypothetical protein